MPSHNILSWHREGCSIHLTVLGWCAVLQSGLCRTCPCKSRPAGPEARSQLYLSSCSVALSWTPCLGWTVVFFLCNCDNVTSLWLYQNSVIIVTGGRTAAPITPGEDQPSPVLTGPCHAEFPCPLTAAGQSPGGLGRGAAPDLFWWQRGWSCSTPTVRLPAVLLDYLELVVPMVDLGVLKCVHFIGGMFSMKKIKLK